MTTRNFFKAFVTLMAVTLMAQVGQIDAATVVLNETTFDGVPPTAGAPNGDPNAWPNPAEPMTDGRAAGASGGQQAQWGDVDTVNGWTWYTEGAGVGQITIDAGTIGDGASVMKEQHLNINNPIATKNNAGPPLADVANLEFGPNGTVSAIIQTFDAVDVGGGNFGEVTIDITMGRQDRSGKGLAWVNGLATNFANFDFVIPNGAAGQSYQTSFTPTQSVFQIGFFSGVGADTNASINSIKVSSEAPEAIPEPSTFVLGVLGLLGLTAFGRRRSTKSACRPTTTKRGFKMHTRSILTTAILATLFVFTATSAQAVLLVYEPFDAPDGTALNAHSGAFGTVGNWTDNGSGAPLGTNGHTIESTDQNGSVAPPPWTGIPVGGYYNEGGFAHGARRDDNSGHIALDPSVTAQFTDGSTI